MVCAVLTLLLQPHLLLSPQARITVVDFLKQAGLYRGVHDNPMRLGISSRSKDVIEPLLKPQWWVACGDMAARSCEAVRNGTLEVIPKVGSSSLLAGIGCSQEPV